MEDVGQKMTELMEKYHWERKSQVRLQRSIEIPGNCRIYQRAS